MDELAFLDTYYGSEVGESNAILKAVVPGGKVMHIADRIRPVKFIESCPLLYHAFEYNAQGRLQAGIEASSEAAVISLVRYCYTGSYLEIEPVGESVRLLQHAETYKIAEDFDVPELQIVAHGNFSCQIEYACCLPKSPDDLLDTIRFIYQNFASDEARRNHNLVDTLLNYCVAVYLIHKLGENLDFLTAVHELPAFRQDLCRTNIVRNFEDDCAAQIIRLPNSPVAESSRAPTTLASRELPTEMYYDFPRVPAPATSTAFAASACFQESTQPTMQSYRRNVLRARPAQREMPDVSKQVVSSIEHAAAFTEYRDHASSDSDDTETDAMFDTKMDRAIDTALEASLHRYKRARFADTASRLAGKSVLPEADAEEPDYKNSARTTTDLENEDLYWAGAASGTPTDPEPTATDVENEDLYWASAAPATPTAPKPTPANPTTSRSPAKHRIDEDDTDTAPAPSSASTATLRAPTTLAYRQRDPSPPSDGFTTDTASEDEDYTVVRKHDALSEAVQDGGMSSPELVPTPSIAETMGEGGVESEDEWTVV